MKPSKTTVIAALAATTVAVAGGTANAAPAPVPHTAPAVVSDAGYHGSDHGVGYRTFLAPAGRAITTTVDAGTFRLTGEAVTLTDRSGTVIASIPLTYDVAGQRVSVAPLVSDAGRTLSLAPAIGTTDAALKTIDANWFVDELNRALPGALIGGLIGAAIGVLFFGVGIIPGAAIGAVIGAVAVGGQPLIDSAFSALPL